VPASAVIVAVSAMVKDFLGKGIASAHSMESRH
jgi:hypothetical protein